MNAKWTDAGFAELSQEKGTKSRVGYLLNFGIIMFLFGGSADPALFQPINT